MGALAACALAGALAVMAGVGQSQRLRPMTLVSESCASNSGFCVTGPGTEPVLYPGAPASPFDLTFTNYSSVPLSVYQLSVTFVNSFPVGCVSSAFQLSGIGMSGEPPSATISLPSGSHVSVPAKSGETPGSTVFKATLALADNGKSQDACQALALHMSYQALASYTVPTSTALTSSPNPSKEAQAVTLAATVSATITPAGAAHTPEGSVTFYECTDGSCSTRTALGSASLNSEGKASIESALSPAGSYKLYASFTPSDSTNFASSNSSQLTQVVSSAGKTTPNDVLASSQNPTAAGAPVTYKATVSGSGPTPTGSVTFKDGGAPITGCGTNGLVKLNASGEGACTVTYGVTGTHTITAPYGGDANYNGTEGNTVSETVNYSYCITTTATTTLTVKSGQDVCIASTGTESGETFIEGGGRLDVLGGTVAKKVTVYLNGALNVMAGSKISASLDGDSPKLFTVCGSTLKGGISVTGATGFVLIGDAGDDGSPTCAPNTSGNTGKTNGTVSLIANKAGAEVSGNTINGNLIIKKTTGTGPGAENASPELEANTVSGELNCLENKPPPTDDGRPNKVTGARAGQCSAAGF